MVSHKKEEFSLAAFLKAELELSPGNLLYFEERLGVCKMVPGGMTAQVVQFTTRAHIWKINSEFVLRIFKINLFNLFI